jgi:phosphoadenosine phosphosulfate reductase
MLDALPHLDADHAALSLNARFTANDAQGLLTHVLRYRPYGHIALISSFGAESVVLLHMAAEIDPATPVLFLDTGRRFSETLTYQEEITARLGLRNVARIAPPQDALTLTDATGDLRRINPDASRALRKVAPFEAALEGFAGWITGHKRIHGGTSAAPELAEAENGHLKLNPLAHWSAADIAAYCDTHELPRHQLSLKGDGSGLRALRQPEVQWSSRAG